MQNAQTSRLVCHTKSKIKARFFFKFKLAMSGKEICIYDRIISQFDNKKKICLLK